MSETLYVLIKRDLYECPEHLGYTGIKELAGAWPLSLVESLTVPVKEAYEPKCHSSYALPQHAAPDFTDACYHDISIDHLKKAVAAKDAEIDRLRIAMENLTRSAGEVSRLGATVGNQWVKLSAALVRARVALKPNSGGAA